MAIHIICDKESYNPGEEIHITVELHFDGPVKARAIYAQLYCMEKFKRTTTRAVPYAEIQEKKRLGLYVDEGYTQEERIDEQNKMVVEKKLGGEKSYRTDELKASLRLPGNANPTSHEFGHDNKITVWKLDIKVDIPLAPDIHEVKEIFVAGL